MEDRVLSMEDRVIFIVREFFEEIDSTEPFENNLVEFKLRLKAKLLEVITAYPSDKESANRSFDSVLEGVDRTIDEFLNKLDTNNEEAILRFIKTLEGINDILKEFLYEDRISDKKKVSSLSGKISNTVQKLRLMWSKKFGGFLRRIKALFGKS
jgi:cellulose biosynthesis protein BcsQ